MHRDPSNYDPFPTNDSTLLPPRKPSLLKYAGGVVRALSRGFSTGNEVHMHSVDSSSTSRKSFPVGNRARTMTEQIELKEKAVSERKHLTAVVSTTIGTTCFLIVLMVAIALAPMPSVPKATCSGCCSDDLPCVVATPPSSFRVLSQSELSVVPSSSSGYSKFLGEIKHKCACTSVESSDDVNKQVVQEFVFERGAAENQNNDSLSLFNHLLDGSAETFWCSLPQTVMALIGMKFCAVAVKY
jgi:hypothetical protein